MSDRRPLINTGVSSRRSACDRCRTQKARCLREEADQARCDRCNRADSDCVTSPVYRMRAWQVISENPAAASTHSGRTRKRQRQQGQDTSQQLLTPAESNGAFGLQHTEEAIGTDDSVSFDHNDFAITTHSWDTQPPPGPEHCLTTGGHSTSYENIFGETMDTYAAGDLDLTNHLFAATTMPSYDAGPTLPPFGPAFAQSLTNDSPHSSDSSPDGRQASQLLQTARIDDTNSKGISPLRVEETPLQQLSRVDYHLITLLSCLGKGPPHVDMDTLVSPIDASRSSTPAVDDILNRTSDFIDILKLLSGDLAPPSSRLGRSHQDLSRHKSPCVGSDDETSMDSPMDSICSTTPSQASKPITQPASALDTGSLIAVLSTYIRVLRLHIVIFAHIEDYLKELAGSDDPVLCPVPGLSFCTFPIESGNLQTIILIQVVTSLFERMESLLGLPREFRIGARKEEPRGLFVQPGFMDIAGPIMRKEDDGQLHHGQGGVKSLRKCIKKSKQLLRDSIAP